MDEKTRRGVQDIDVKFWPWDVSVDTTRPALSRCMEAILETRSRLTDSMIALGSRKYPLGRGVSAEIRVQITEGWEDRFRWLAHPISMTAPPRICIGMVAPIDDGHPGRQR